MTPFLTHYANYHTNTCTCNQSKKTFTLPRPPHQQSITSSSQTLQPTINFTFNSHSIPTTYESTNHPHTTPYDTNVTNRHPSTRDQLRSKPLQKKKGKPQTLTYDSQDTHTTHKTRPYDPQDKPQISFMRELWEGFIGKRKLLIMTNCEHSSGFKHLSFNESVPWESYWKCFLYWFSPQPIVLQP